MIETGDMEFESRAVAPEYTESDAETEFTLRPQTLQEYIGQDKVKENLAIYIEAAKRRGEPLDHVLLYGPPGLGKTTLAGIIAHEMGANLRITTGPAIEKPGDLAALLTNLSANDVLFIDEIHRLSRSIEEILYPALEDNALDIIIGKGPSARSIRVDLEKFTLVGATTRAGQLTSPLRDRFGIVQRLELYSHEQLSDIIRRSGTILGIPCTSDGALEIAKRSRGTPRIANRFLKRVRDFAEVMGDGEITGDIASIALNRLEVDSLGLDSLDKRMLTMLIKGYNGGPAGLETHSGAFCGGLRPDTGALHRHRTVVRTRKQHPHRGAAPRLRDRHADEAQGDRHPDRTPHRNGHLVPVHAARRHEHAARDGRIGGRHGCGRLVGNRLAADDAVGRAAAARRGRLGALEHRETGPGLLLPRPEIERAARPLDRHVHPRRGGRGRHLHRPGIQPRRPGADHLGTDAGAESDPHRRIRRLGQETGA